MIKKRKWRTNQRKSENLISRHYYCQFQYSYLSTLEQSTGAITVINRYPEARAENIIISFGKYTELLTHLGSMHSLISWRKANGNHRHLSSFKLQFPGNSKFLTNSILQHHFSRSIYRPVGPGPVLFQSTDLVFERLRYLPRDHRMCAPIHQLTTNLHT